MTDPTNTTGRIQFEAGQVWRPKKPGSGSRKLHSQLVNPRGDELSYSTPSGLRRRIHIDDFRAWVDRFECEVSST